MTVIVAPPIFGSRSRTVFEPTLASRSALSPTRRSACISKFLSARGSLWTHQVQLTIADFVAEVHDTHHAISVGEYYEDQRPEAAKRMAAFRKSRIPKYLD